MLRLLPFLAMLGLAVLALIDCLARDDDEIRGLPKVVWVFVILLFPLLGSIVWFLAGRPRPASAGPGPWRPGFGVTGGQPPPRRPVAPDDDPDFLRGLRNRPRDDDDERRTDS
jgi:hypothetical protein